MEVKSNMSNLAGGILKPLARIRGGVEAMHQKAGSDIVIVRMPIPETVVIPMSQSIGAPCDPLVKPGDHVDVGQKIGDSARPISAPVHASISGTVKSVGEVHLANGMISKAVTIESDGLMTLSEEVKPPVINSFDDLIHAVRECGLVGLGGAGFPTHAKLSSAFSGSTKVDTLIINAAECEPYICVDNRECIEHPQDILDGIEALLKWCGFEQVIIGVEDNKPKAFDTLKKIAESDDEADDRIKLMALRSHYPQGAEKMMILVTTGRKVPPGKLPSDVGCVVMNVQTVAVLGRYLHTGKPLVTRSVTVDGTAIPHTMNVRVPVGTNIQELIDFCGGFSGTPKKIIFGGPMMGIALSNTDAPICKQNNAILAFKDGPEIDTEEKDCIRCGRCAAACPMNLVPADIERYTKTRNLEGLAASGVTVCMECGSCAYHCPAKRALVQYMRLGKQLLREGAQKK